MRNGATTRLGFYIQVIAAFALAVAVAVAGATEAGDGVVSQRMTGQRLYRDGMLSSGEALVGLAPAGVVRRGADAACIACHRRSGFGIAEGSFVVRPIAGADLYQTRTVVAATQRIAHQLGKPRRPAYDDETLARAIATGIDVTGRPLHEMMPRYPLKDADMKALIAYLKTLYDVQAPGVTDEVIHLATVIQPEVPAAKRTAMLNVLQAFIRDKNAGVRSEEQRRTAGAMRMYRAYRKWALHVWELTGPQETWGAQLEARYREQPVFALVSGIGGRSWQPIHEFSERYRVPCILPLTSLPAVSDRENFYTVYFSRGISLEAESLAKYLSERREARRIVQVYRRGAPGAVAAARFRAALPDTGGLEDMPLDQTPSDAFWRALAGRRSSVIVLWLSALDLAGAMPFWGADDAMPPTVYLSASLLDGMAAPGGSRTLMTYPWEMPTERTLRVRRTQDWLRARALASSDEDVQINTHFAMTMVGEALAHLMDSFSREYFVERVEHDVTTTLMPSYFPPLSLGPDQRYASKGVYIVRTGDTGAPLAAVSELIVP